MGANDCCCGKYNAREGSKIIGVTSAVLMGVAAIGFAWDLIKLSQAESQLSQVLTSLRQFGEQLGGDANTAHDDINDAFKNRRIALGASIGLALFSMLVAIALVFAAKKNNRLLALPFMIWTIITQICTGIAIAFFIFIVAVNEWKPEEQDDLIRYFVVPGAFSIVSFVIYTWFLVVVFNFYNLLKSGQAFDSIPMQTA